MQSVLVTGGTGLVGKQLCQRLDTKGYSVKILSRRKKILTKYRYFYWNPAKKEIEKEALENTDFIIHLAGANVSSKRWGHKRKQEIINSRAGAAKFLFDSVLDCEKKPIAFISSSAVGIYGSTSSDKIFSETDPIATDFLAETCRQWETAADLFGEAGIRTVKIRTGLVLAKEGPLSKIMFPVKLGVGSPVGNGLQYMPWVHIDDLCNIFVLAIENSEFEGAYNAAAPDHKTNEEFTKILAKVLKKPLWLPNIPKFVLQAILGEMAVIILYGNRVSSEKILKTGYKFKFPLLNQALEDICKV